MQNRIIATGVVGTMVLAAAAARGAGLPATDSLTVRPAGVRTGASGTNFFDAEGDTAAANAAYGVLDFAGGDPLFAGDGAGVSGLTLQLVESNAAFSAPGSVEVFLASDATNTPPNYTAGTSPMGVGTTGLFGNLLDLGALSFTTTGATATGQVDTFSNFTLTASESQVLASDVTNGSLIRLVLTPNTAGTSATYGGSTSNITPVLGTAGVAGIGAPTLLLTPSAAAAVPEPASVALAGFAAMGLAGRRRRNA